MRWKLEKLGNLIPVDDLRWFVSFLAQTFLWLTAALVMVAGVLLAAWCLAGVWSFLLGADFVWGGSS